MVSRQKIKLNDQHLRESNRIEYERRWVVHFTKVTTRHFRESFRYFRHGSWHLRDYLKYSAKAAINSGLGRLGIQKLLKRKS